VEALKNHPYIKAAAVTDHDTIAGLEEIRQHSAGGYFAVISCVHLPPKRAINYRTLDRNTNRPASFPVFVARKYDDFFGVVLF